MKSTQSKLCPQQSHSLWSSPQGHLKRHFSAFQKEHGKYPFQCLELLLPKRTRWCGRIHSKIKAWHFLKILPRKAQVSHQEKGPSYFWERPDCNGSRELRPIWWWVKYITKIERQMTSGYFFNSGWSGCTIFVAGAIHTWHVNISFLVGVSGNKSNVNSKK